MTETIDDTRPGRARMRMTKRSVSLAASALLVLAACSGEAEPTAEPTAVGSGAESDDRVEQLQTQVDEMNARLGDADLADLESRLSELESEVDLLAAAVEEQQEPARLGGSAGGDEASPEAPDTGDANDEDQASGD